MTYKEQLESKYSALVQKSGSVINGYNTAIANTLQEVKNFCTFVSTISDIKDMKNDTSTNNKKPIGEILLYYLASFFAVNEMAAYEKNSLVTKLKYLFIRDSLHWGTIPDIKSILKKYYGIKYLYVIENGGTEKSNLINGEFDTTTGWTFVNAGISPEAAFQSSYGCYLKTIDGNKASYSINLEAGTYYLHFFAKLVKNESSGSTLSSGLNITISYPGKTLITGTILDASSGTKNEWNCFSRSFKIPSQQTVTIQFNDKTKSGSDVGVYLDYVQLYKYVGYPNFQVIAVYEGGFSNKTFCFDEDNTHGAAEIGNSYFEGAKNVGIQSEIEFLVDYLRPVGVKCYIDTQLNTSGIQDDYVSEGILYTFSGDTLDKTYNSADFKSVDGDIYDTNV